MNKIEINHDDPKAFSTFFEQTLPTFVGLFGLSTVDWIEQCSNFLQQPLLNSVSTQIDQLE
jgi:hypothetical protein